MFHNYTQQQYLHSASFRKLCAISKVFCWSRIACFNSARRLDVHFGPSYVWPPRGFAKNWKVVTRPARHHQLMDMIPRYQIHTKIKSLHLYVYTNLNWSIHQQSISHVTFHCLIWAFGQMCPLCSSIVFVCQLTFKATRQLP